MTYISHRQGKGTSTKLISARIATIYVEKMERFNFSLGRVVNYALTDYVHDLQTEHNISHDIYWLSNKQAFYTPYQTDWRGTIHKMVRVRCDLLDYLKMNSYQVNTAINLAIERFMYKIRDGKIDQTTIRQISSRGWTTYSVEELKLMYER